MKIEKDGTHRETYKHSNGLVVVRTYCRGVHIDSKFPRLRNETRGVKIPLKFPPLRLGLSIYK